MKTPGTNHAKDARTRIRIDLHIHTVLSPCAEVEMIPPLIVQRAAELGLGLIAITDHNSAENVEAVQEAAKGFDIRVIPGMEVQTREEVHILCLFETLAQLQLWQERVYDALPAVKNRPDVFGAQFVVDATGDYVRENERLLLASVDLSTESVVASVRDLGGMAIAAHVDRPSYSILANLGFVPEELPLSGLEISPRATLESVCARYPGLDRWPIICSSDAHRLSDMCVAAEAVLAAPTFIELRLALEGRGGRSVELLA